MTVVEMKSIATQCQNTWPKAKTREIFTKKLNDMNGFTTMPKHLAKGKNMREDHHKKLKNMNGFTKSLLELDMIIVGYDYCWIRLLLDMIGC